MRTAAVLLVALTCAGSAQAEDDLLAIRAGTVITVSGEEHSPGMIVVRNGVVEAVGPKIEIPSRARRIDAPDQVVMPGLVHPRTRFGLRSYRRSGNHADLSAASELTPRPGDYRAAREAGFVLLGLIPAGSSIPGRAVGARPLEGGRAAMVVEGSGYLRIGMVSLPGDKRTLVSAFQAAEKAIEREEKAKQAFDDKLKKAEAEAKKKAAEEKAKKEKGGKKPDKVYGADTTAGLAEKDPKKDPKKPDPKKKPEFKPPPIPPAYLPFVDLIRDPASAPRLLVELSRARDLLHYDDAVRKWKASPAFYLGNGETSDLHLVAGKLGERKALVVLTPRLSFEPYTRTRRNLPAELVKAGARLAFVPQSDDAAGLRAHMAAVGHLVREGLDRAAALRALTVVPAELLGVDHEQGSIEKGRRADLVFLDGDPFAAGTRVARVLVGGAEVWPEEDRP